MAKLLAYPFGSLPSQTLPSIILLARITSLGRATLASVAACGVRRRRHRRRVVVIDDSLPSFHSILVGRHFHAVTGPPRWPLLFLFHGDGLQAAGVKPGRPDPAHQPLMALAGFFPYLALTDYQDHIMLWSSVPLAQANG